MMVMSFKNSILNSSTLSFLFKVQQEPPLLPLLLTSTLLFSILTDCVLWTNATTYHQNASLKATLESRLPSVHHAVLQQQGNTWTIDEINSVS